MDTTNSLTLRLTLDVTYDLNGTNPAILRDMLDELPRDASGNGLLSGDTAAEVDTWTHRVDEIAHGALTPDKLTEALSRIADMVEGDDLAWAIKVARHALGRE